MHIDFSIDDDFEPSYDELIRNIHKAPLYKKPKIGGNPFEEEKTEKVQLTISPVFELIEAMVTDYENGDPTSMLFDLAERLGLSRIKTEILISKALLQGYIKAISEYEFKLTESGKHFAINNGLAE